MLDLATRTYDTYGRLVGATAAEQDDTRGELDASRAELAAYYDECFDVARNRTGAFARREKRKAVRTGARGDAPGGGRATAARGLTATGVRRPAAEVA